MQEHADKAQFPPVLDRNYYRSTHGDLSKLQRRRINTSFRTLGQQPRVARDLRYRLGSILYDLHPKKWIHWRLDHSVVRSCGKIGFDTLILPIERR